MSELREAMAAQLQLDAKRGAAAWPEARAWIEERRSFGAHHLSCTRCGERLALGDWPLRFDFELLHSLCLEAG